MFRHLWLLLWLGVIAWQALADNTIIDVLASDPQFETLLKHLERTHLIPFFSNLTAGTCFAPHNDAFADFGDKPVTREMLLYHVLPTAMTGQDFYDHQLLETLYVRPKLLGSDNAGQRIKVTKIGNPTQGRGKVYINGAQIVQKDVPVNNQTIIQVIEKVLEPPNLLGDILSERTELYSLMSSVGIDNLLKQPRPFTVFVSKKHILEKFNDIEKAYMTSDYGKKDLSHCLKYMILEGVIYGADFPSGTTPYQTLSGESVSISVGKDSSITVGGIGVQEKDILAANGIIHVLDDTPLPSQINFNARKYLYGLNATTFVSMFDDYHLGHYLEDESHQYTFLVPPNEDMNRHAVPENAKKDWLKYHVLTQPWKSGDIHDRMLLQTAFTSRRLDDVPQRVKAYVSIDSKAGKSIQFGHSRVLGDIAIRDQIIYRVSEPLSLPGEMLSNLVTDLDLSTFIATLYVSNVASEIKWANGITLFVPTNDAFQELGIVAKYLTHPSAKDHLQSVLRFHVAKDLLYHDDMLQEVHEVTTLANEPLRIGPQKDGSIVVSRPDGADDASQVGESDMLASNGVVHKINQVQIPNQIRITNTDLLRGIEANTMIEILDKAGLLGPLNRTEVVVLAPTDKAFAYLDLQALMADPYELERVAKLHLLPMPWKDVWAPLSSHGAEYPTLLSDRDTVVIRQVDDEIIISVKDRSNDKPAHVIGRGKASAGYGGVVVLDTVLTPVRRGLFGLPLVWSIILVTVISVVTATIVGVCSFFAYKIWTRRRLGYRSI